MSTKLDSDSKLQLETSKLVTNGTAADLLPKNSVSDSKLAVDYFNSPAEVRKSPISISVSIMFQIQKMSSWSISKLIYCRFFCYVTIKILFKA